MKSDINFKQNSVIEFLEKCKKYAISQVNIQKEQIKRLGVVCDVSNCYLTLDKEYEAINWKYLKNVNQNFIKK